MNMKTAGFLFTLVGFGALTLGPGFAGQPSDQAPERAPSENRAKTTSESHASGKSGQTGGTKTTAKGHSGPKLPQPFQRNGGHPGGKRTNNAQTIGTSANAAERHQPGWNKSAGGVKTGWIADEMERQRRLAVAGLPGTPPPNQVVHRPGPGQAAIGGPTIWSASNTAVINGTGMKHRP
jgi:hypothetical protein